MSEIRIGCSGWNYQHWRNGVFYPPRLAARRWLDFYSAHFDTVEINSTFYRLPRETAVANWVRESRPGFLFAVKMSRYTTHIKRLRDLGPSIALFYDRIRPFLGSPKFGPVLWQLPPDFRRDDDRLASALAQLPAGRHCFEFRHESWFAEPVYALLREHGMALVIGDDPRRPFQTYELTTDWTFIRFHSGTRGRGGNYSQTELEEWSRRIEAWAGVGDVYAYFNNDWNGYALRNGATLQRLLGVTPYCATE
ncbi:MAG TPA: DUF72 domain-containing protein [Gaiellaceae bacterium]|nr:DUF72 domain-containing protein [Gaiellaceae bacterium]